MNNPIRSFDDLPLTLCVDDLRDILQVGRNTAYDLVKSGQIGSIRVGRQLRIPKHELIAFLNHSAN